MSTHHPLMSADHPRLLLLSLERLQPLPCVMETQGYNGQDQNNHFSSAQMHETTVLRQELIFPI